MYLTCLYLTTFLFIFYSLKIIYMCLMYFDLTHPSGIHQPVSLRISCSLFKSYQFSNIQFCNDKYVYISAQQILRRF